MALNPLLLQILLKVGGIGTFSYLLLCGLLLVGQNRLIFVPCQETTTTPDQQGLTYENVWLPIGENQECLHGWWLPNTTTEDVLLYFHGNGGNISVNLHRAERYHRLGFSIFLIDYRGYGKSQGKFPTETQVYQDAQRAWDYLVEERNIPPKHIIVYGHSLGGAIAIDLGTHHPDMAGLIIEGSFTSMKEIAHRLGNYRIFPLDFLLTHKFDSLSKVKTLSIPILLIHGTEDATVPSDMSQTLFEIAEEPKKLLLVPGADHHNASSIDEQKYLQTIQDFWQEIRSSD